MAADATASLAVADSLLSQARSASDEGDCMELLAAASEALGDAGANLEAAGDTAQADRARALSAELQALVNAPTLPGCLTLAQFQAQYVAAIARDAAQISPSAAQLTSGGAGAGLAAALGLGTGALLILLIGLLRRRQGG
ncbi:MAG: hypothetical protein ABSH07_12695 [Candidatus Dormibacteria bacterium]|jgi:hypothetical protein